MLRALLCAFNREQEESVYIIISHKNEKWESVYTYKKKQTSFLFCFSISQVWLFIALGNKIGKKKNKMNTHKKAACHNYNLIFISVFILFIFFSSLSLTESEHPRDAASI